jgi:hypothetical protein
MVPEAKPPPEPQIHFVAESGKEYWVPSGIETGLIDGKLHLFLMRRSGDRFELRIDGVARGLATVPASERASNDAPLLVGACNGADNQNRGVIAAAAILQGTINDAELADIERFFVTAYLPTGM